MEKPPDTVSFDYIKSNHFRVVHADGIWGGVTPRLEILLGIWSERPPIPTRITHEVNNELVGAEINRELRDAIIREMEVAAVMTVSTAKALQKWLADKTAL